MADNSANGMAHCSFLDVAFCFIPHLEAIPFFPALIPFKSRKMFIFN
jgi:hypothetical protein